MTRPLSKTELESLAPVEMSSIKDQQREYRRLFSAALRSGKYKQCRGRFSEPGKWPWSRYSYCALGLAEAVGIANRDNIEDLMGTRGRGSIMAMSDCGHKTFVQIADWIDAQP